MRSAFLILLLGGVPQDEGRIEEAIRQFKDAWRRAVRDEGGRAAAVVPLTLHRHEKILELLFEKLEGEDSPNVKEALVKALSQYVESEKVAGTLYDQLKKNRKMPNVMQAVFQGLGSLKPAVSRPRVEEIHELVKHRDMSLAVPAVNSLGCIRHKSSIPVLMERLRRAQQDMRDYIKGQNLPNCDSD